MREILIPTIICACLIQINNSRINKRIDEELLELEEINKRHLQKIEDIVINTIKNSHYTK